MIRRPPRSTLDRSSAASDVYKRQLDKDKKNVGTGLVGAPECGDVMRLQIEVDEATDLSLIHISEPTRPY